MHIHMDKAPPRSRLRRWPWLLASVLLLAATAATARATYLFWLPCRGSMIDGLMVIRKFDGAIPEACLEQMDAGTPFPFPSDQALVRYAAAGPQLAAAAMVLTGLAWLVLVLGLRWRLRTVAVAAVPALLSLALGLSSARAARSGGAAEEAYAATPWWLVLEGSAVAVLVIVRRWQPELSDADIARLAMLLWGVTAYGYSHAMLDYMIMVYAHSWNWDCPPGCGYPTVVAIALAAGLAAGAALPKRLTG